MGNFFGQWATLLVFYLPVPGKIRTRHGQVRSGTAGTG